MNKQDILIVKAAAKSLEVFVKVMLKANPSKQQLEVIRDIDNGATKISIRSGHGTGKTALLSWIVLWWGIFREDAKIPMTAPTGHQLFDLLMPEVKKWRDKMPDQLKNEVEVRTEKIDYANGSFAVPRTARKDQPEALQGFHATNLAFIIDEASGIPQVIFEVAEGAMTGENTLVVMTANPTRVEGYFYDSHHKNRWQWNCYQFNAEETENVSQKWVEEKKRQYGEDSDVYRVRVRGEFPKQSSNAVFSLQEIEDAITRTSFLDDGMEVWGVDVAEQGTDKSVISKRKGMHFYELVSRSGLRLPEVRDWIKFEIERSGSTPDYIFTDEVGVGYGLADLCHEEGLDMVVGVKGSEKASEYKKYENKRTEWYYRLRDVIGEGKIMDDDELIGELMAQKYIVSTSGRLALIKKDEIRKELGRSPDKSDASAMTCESVRYVARNTEYMEDVFFGSKEPYAFNYGGGVW